MRMSKIEFMFYTFTIVVISFICLGVVLSNYKNHTDYCDHKCGIEGWHYEEGDKKEYPLLYPGKIEKCVCNTIILNITK